MVNDPVRCGWYRGYLAGLLRNARLATAEVERVLGTIKECVGGPDCTLDRKLVQACLADMVRVGNLLRVMEQAMVYRGAVKEEKGGS